MSDPKDDDVRIYVMGFIAAKTLAPAVEIQVGEIKTQVSAEKAREIGLMILTASEAAMSDAFLIKFFLEKTGAPLDKTMGIVLQDFRAFRDEQRRKEEAP